MGRCQRLQPNPRFVSFLMTVSVTHRVSHETCPSPKVIAVILMFTKPLFQGLCRPWILMGFALQNADSLAFQ
jgi:hypothetical protein